MTWQKLCAVVAIVFCGMMSPCLKGSALAAAEFSIPMDGLQISGKTYVIKGQSPDDLHISSTIVCKVPTGEVMPSGSFSVKFELTRDFGESVTVSETTFSYNPVWELCTYNVPDGINEYDICQTTVEYDLPLPREPGAMQTSEYGITITLLEQDPKNPWMRIPFYSQAFPYQIYYTVFSGRLMFGGIETTMTDLTLGESLSMADYDISSVAGTWTHAWGTENIAGNNLTAYPYQMSDDGYSTDLMLMWGSLYVGSVLGDVSGMGVQLVSVELGYDGGSFTRAIVSLPETVSAHVERDNRISPRGIRSMQFAGGSFSKDIDAITLSGEEPLFFHGYGLPFYVGSTGASFPLGDSSGIALQGLDVRYVHEALFAALAENDPRHSSGFPTNDILFSDSFWGQNVQITGSGISGEFMFDAGFNGGETAFPKAHVMTDPWTLDLVDGKMAVKSMPNINFWMTFGGDCPEGPCGDQGAPVVEYRVGSASGMMLSSGAFGGIFADLGQPRFVEEGGYGRGISWGGYDEIYGSTFSRNDSSKKGLWMVPGFIMTGTAQDGGVARVLLGSATFPQSDTGIPEGVHHLNDPKPGNAFANQGDGFFAGINLGPEVLVGDSAEPGLIEGFGQMLDNGLSVRFSGNNQPTKMDDRPATKYVFRPGGLTGVFNTGFMDTATIYNYPIGFDRFAFRQDRNRPDALTFIDGELTLYGPVGGKEGMRIGFYNLEITCNGNIGQGQVDAEPEPKWPISGDSTGGNGSDDDGDGRIDEGCHVLDYWNMPVLLTGMAFVNLPGQESAGDCATDPRKLELATRNQVDGIGSLLDMVALYSPDGLIENQQISGAVDTWFDKPVQGGQPGFPLRLQTAYLNQIGSALPEELPEWEGFMVLGGLTDVPLFHDARLSGHFINNTPLDFNDYDLFVFQNETDADTDRDGVPNDADSGGGNRYGTVADYRDALQADGGQAPKPHFEYSWPTSGLIDLNYFADYNAARGDAMPEFAGIKKSSSLVNVLEIHSVPDYITPERTKFSFGASADLTAMGAFQVDLGNLTGGLDDFLQDQLGVSSTFSLEAMMGELVSAERLMHDLTGGDLTQVLGSALDLSLRQAPLADGITAVVDGINRAHQAPHQLMGMVREPVGLARETIQGRISAELRGELKVFYNDMAPMFYYNADVLEAKLIGMPGAPDAVAFSDLVDRLNVTRNQLLRIVDALDDTESMLAGAGRALSLDAPDGDLYRLTVQVNAAIDQTLAVKELLVGAAGLAHYWSNDSAANPFLGKVEAAQTAVSGVRNAIAAIDLELIGEALRMGASLSGVELDTSLIQSAQGTVRTALNQLDQVIGDARSSLESVYGSLDLGEIEASVGTHLEGTIPLSLAVLKTELAELSQEILPIIERSRIGIAAVRAHVSALTELQGNVVELPDGVDWATAVEHGRLRLDALAASFIHSVNTELPGEYLATLMPDPAVEVSGYAALYINQNLLLDQVIIAPFNEILLDVGTGTQGLDRRMNAVLENSLALLPHPSEADIRNMIRTAVLNTQAVRSLNGAFYEQFGFISDNLDDVSSQVTMQVNSLIKSAVAAVSDGLGEQLKGIQAGIGESAGWGGIGSAGIDGYAIVSQDEVERIHLEASFTLEAEPDDTTFNAALDITSWNAENGKGACIESGGSGNVDVVISTHDVSADMLGMSVGLKQAALGFTTGEIPRLDGIYGPLGIFGYVYLLGDLDFEVVVFEDLGMEAGLGFYENYFGATGAARFDDYAITKAAFYLGKSCSFDVLERLDSEVAEFIGEIVPLTGIYARGAAEVPIWNNGCVLKVGVGADIGAWYFTEPSPGTFGGLLGGSAFGKLACLASLKGKVTCLGMKSGPDYVFSGSGWGAAGVGWCSPGRWKSVRDARRDDWCTTGDVTFGARYRGTWELDGADVNCCH